MFSILERNGEKRWWSGVERGADWSADPGLGLVMMPDVDRSSTAKASQPAKVKAKSQGKSQIQSKSRPRLTDRSKVVQLAGTGRKDHLAATIPSERCLCGAFSSLGLGQRNSYLGSGVQVKAESRAAQY